MQKVPAPRQSFHNRMQSQHFAAHGEVKPKTYFLVSACIQVCAYTCVHACMNVRNAVVGKQSCSACLRALLSLKLERAACLKLRRGFEMPTVCPLSRDSDSMYTCSSRAPKHHVDSVTVLGFVESSILGSSCLCGFLGP